MPYDWSVCCDVTGYLGHVAVISLVRMANKTSAQGLKIRPSWLHIDLRCRAVTGWKILFKISVRCDQKHIFWKHFQCHYPCMNAVCNRGVFQGITHTVVSTNFLYKFNTRVELLANVQLPLGHKILVHSIDHSSSWIPTVCQSKGPILGVVWDQYRHSWLGTRGLTHYHGPFSLGLLGTVLCSGIMSRAFSVFLLAKA